MTQLGGSVADQTWTIMRLIQWTEDYLKRKDVDSPRLSAEVLLAHVLGYDRVKLYTNFDEVVNPDKRASFKNLVTARAAGEPVKYLTGHADFMSISFLVDRRVLIPRPETELLVEKAMERASPMPAPQIADIGTGCGNIAVSLAVNLPKARLWATDVSQGALDVARANAESANVAHRITFLLGDLYKPLLDAGLTGELDIICSNPPYVPEAQWESLSREIREHEPEIALKAGPDGLKYLIPLIEGASRMFKDVGYLLLEIGDDQGPAVKEAASRSGAYSEVEVLKDYGGHDRLFFAARKGEVG